MRATDRCILIALVATLCCVSTSFAADQTLLGRRFTQRDPTSGVDPSKRSIKVTAHENQSPNALRGDPTLVGSGGTVTLFLNGSPSGAFSEVLPQGIGPSGSAYWTGSAASRFQYADPKGVNGPVKKVKIKRGRNGTFTVGVQMSGEHGVLPSPSATNTEACLAIVLGSGPTSERYSILFGNESDVKSEPNRLFEAKNPTIEGVCPSSESPCGDTYYPTCGGACGPGEVCRSLSGHPASFDATGFCACVAAGGPTDCPPGSAYQVGGDHNEAAIGCSPIPTCNDVQSSGYDAGCPGGVAAGSVCQPVRVIEPSVGANASICIPYPATESCDGVCGLTGGGVCPSGEVCAVSGGFEGMDCGCFTPPLCADSLTCGGACPNGTCLACPPEICGPAPSCLCSGD